MQTAIIWLLQELEKVNYHPTEAMMMYAKKLEKQQIIDANYDGQRLHSKSCTKQMLQDNAESYFAETYGSKGSDDIKGIGSKDINGNEFIFPTSSQTEISDKEIEKASNEGWVVLDSNRTDNWIRGAKWYREQLKNK